MEKKQGRTRGSHSKCERRIWLQTFGASHAYTLVYATANIGVLQLCFSPGLRPLLRCFTCSVQLSGGRSCLRHQAGRITRVASFPRYRIRLSCVVTSHYVYRSRHDRER